MESLIPTKTGRVLTTRRGRLIRARGRQTSRPLVHGTGRSNAGILADFNLASQVDLVPQTRGNSQGRPGERLLPLSFRDRRIAVNLLKAAHCQEHSDVDAMEQQRELQLMLLLNIKAEIQLLDNSGDITNWLNSKIGL